MEDFRTELMRIINICSKENGSNTPDHILGKFLQDCLAAFDQATNGRDFWYGVNLEPGRKYFKADLGQTEMDKSTE